MIPVNAVNERAMVLLGADSATLNQTPVAFKLVKEAFTPGPELVFADLTLADFTGSSALGILHPAPESVDPANGDPLLDLGTDIPGGLRWETTNTVNLPQTIYGLAMYDTTTSTLLASYAFDTPLELTAANQSVVVDRMTFRLNSGGIS